MYECTPLRSEVVTLVFFQIFSFYLYERRGGREENSGEERERERIRERGYL